MQGKAYIKDNWPLMSQQVIPFTTQLAQTRNFELLQSGLSWVGWLSALVALPQMQRAFELLDEKYSRFALEPFRVLVPQLTMLFIIACLTISAGVDAALVATYAHDADESALLFTTVTAFFVILAVLVSIATAWVLRTHHTTYTIVWIIFAVLAIFAVFGGSIVSAQAGGISSFVGPNWDQIRVFVPTEYQDNGANTYIRDAETLLRYAGLGGVMLFLFSTMLSATACHSAFLLTALAPAVKAGPDAIHHAVASLRGGLAPDGQFSGTSGAAASLSPSEVTSGYYGSLGAGDEEGGPHASTGVGNDGGVGSSRPTKGAAATRDEEEEGIDEIQIEDSDEEEEEAAAKRASEGMERGRSASGLELRSHGRGSISEASTGNGMSFGPSLHSVASASVLGGYDRKALPSKDDHTMPSWGEYVQISVNHLRRELGSRVCCLVGVAVLVVVGCALLGIGLGEVGNAARCGALARGTAPTSTYSLSIKPDYRMSIQLNNTFPGGRVRYVAYEGGPGIGRDDINITLTTWSLDSSRIWSQRQFEDAIQYNTQNTTIPQNFLFVAMLLAGDIDTARQSCDTAELLVEVPLSLVDISEPAIRRGDTPAQQLREAADQATAMVKGTRVEDERETYVAQPRFDLFATSATSIPEGASPFTHAGAYALELERVNEVRAAAAAEPEAALAELMARVEDPTAVSAIPPIVVMGSATAAGYGKNGPASRRGQAPLRIGPASGPGAFYLTAQDEFEERYRELAVEHLERIRGEALAKYPGFTPLEVASSAADVRSWTKLLDAKRMAEAAVQQAGEGGLEAAKATLRAVSDAVSRLNAPPRYVQGAAIFIRSPHAYVDFKSSLVYFPPAMTVLDIETDTASIVLDSSLGQAEYPPKDAPALRVVSNTGDVNISSFVVPGIEVQTSGDAFMLGLASAEFTTFPPPPALSGKKRMDVHTTGTGTLTITEGLGGYDFDASTENGLLLVYNCAGAVGTSIGFEAKGTADVWFTTLILAGGNITNVKTHGGTVHANVVYSNRFIVDGSQGGSAALVELFLGIVAPTTAIVPPLTSNYSHPGLIANNPEGSISVTGISGAPTSSCPAGPPGQFTSTLVVDLRTTLNPISVQINGGGINAPYSVHSEHGQATMNIIGNNAPLTGVLGIVSDTYPSSGYFRAESDYGDIDVVELENSIPDLSSINILL